MDARAERRRRVRSWVSAGLVAAGTVTFWAAMTMDFVGADLRPGVRPEGFSGRPCFYPGTVGDGPESNWAVATTCLPFVPSALVCAAAPVLWMSAAWMRSAWSRYVGAGACAATLMALLAVFTVPGAVSSLFPSLTMARLYADDIDPFSDFLLSRPGDFNLAAELGGWAWGASAMLLTCAFLVLPAPRRPEPGELLDPAIVRRVPIRIAIVLEVAGVFGLLYLAGLLPAPAWFAPTVGDFANEVTAAFAEWRPRRHPLGGLFDEPSARWMAQSLVVHPALFALACRVRDLRWIAVGITLCAFVPQVVAALTVFPL